MATVHETGARRGHPMMITRRNLSVRRKGKYEKEILEKSSSVGYGGFLYGDRSRLRRIFGYRSNRFR